MCVIDISVVAVAVLLIVVLHTFSVILVLAYVPLKTSRTPYQRKVPILHSLSLEFPDKWPLLVCDQVAL